MWAATLGFILSIEIDMVFVWVVEIDVISTCEIDPL